MFHILYAFCSLVSLHWAMALGDSLVRIETDASSHEGDAQAAQGHSTLELSSSGRAQVATSSIPLQLVMTGKEESIDQLPSHLRRNVKRTLALNPGMKLHYLSDRQCRMYVRQHCDDELADIYNAEKAGHFRGDICRAAVLLQEGGFYADLDLEPAAPFKSLVDDSTKFMSVFTHDGAILNALMASAPGSPVMKQALQEMKEWYKGTHEQVSSDGQWMGTVTLMRALRSVMQTNCPETDLDSQRQSSRLQWECGTHHFRFYHEARLDCGRKTLFSPGLVSQECPPARMTASFVGLKYGIFTPTTPRQIVAWPRAISCDSWWCGGR